MEVVMMRVFECKCILYKHICKTIIQIIHMILHFCCHHHFFFQGRDVIPKKQQQIISLQISKVTFVTHFEFITNFIVKFMQKIIIM